jgi:hypothetical protein
MLEVQKYLRSGKTLDDLAAELGIKVTLHPILPLCILNYSQLDSPKIHPIVRECRGLTLEKDSWFLVAKSFQRFYNWGEVDEPFDFSDCLVQEKVDGSLVLIYYYAGQWRANTRGSFAQDLLQFQTFTWQEAFLKALNIQSLEQLDLDQAFCYVCEFVSPWNKVVRHYPTPMMYLLTAFNGEYEVDWNGLQGINGTEKFQLPLVYHFTNIEDIQGFLQQQAESDPTFEGVVLRDRAGCRFKVKSATYLGLHRIGSSKECLFNPKNLLPFVLAGEESELICYFPEVKERFLELKCRVLEWYGRLVEVWADCKDIESQKEFALAVKGKTPYTGILFDLRKKGKQTSKDLRDAWKKSEHLILKQL